MRKFTLFVTSVTIIFAIGVISCTKKSEGSIIEGENSRLSFAASVPDVFVSTQSSSGKAEAEELLEKGTTIGVHILNINDGSIPTESKLADNMEPDFSNIQYTVNDDKGTIVNAAGEDVILVTGFTYDMYAYSPYNANVTGSLVNAIPVLHNTDILWAKTPNQTPNGPVFSSKLDFKHKSSKISFNVVSSDGQTIPFEGGSVTVTGFYASGTMDLSKGTVAVTGEIDTNHDIVFSTTTTSETFHFLPTGSDMPLKIVVTIPLTALHSDVYTGTYTRNFRAGESYTVEIAVRDVAVDLGFTGKTEAWIPVIDDIGVTNDPVK